MATSSQTSPPVTWAHVQQAAERLAPHVHRTPVVTSRTFDEWAGRQLFFKCENLQKVGAFKFRGACNAILQLAPDQAGAGVVTHSSGNHAQALALAAKQLGAPAYIVMPRTAPSVKRQAVEAYGGQVFPCEPTLAAREETAARIAQETGAHFVPPYDHPHIIEGQGTAAYELLEEVPDLDAMIAPVGGGGLISGTCAVAKLGPHALRVFAAEPRGADDAARSKAAGQWLPSKHPQTIADGLLTSLGELTWPYVRDYVNEVMTVDDAEIVRVMRLFWERMKLIIEPSAAVSVAVALSDAFRNQPNIRRVGIILSGGNLDLQQLPWLTLPAE